MRLHLNVLQNQRKYRKLDGRARWVWSRRNGSPSHGFEDQILSLESYDRFVRNKYIVFQLILHCKDKFSAAFMNKIKFWVWIILYILAMKSLQKKIDVLLSIMDLILNYVICGNVENLPNEERFSSPKLQLDRNLESCNLIAWWMRNFIFGN